MDDTYACADCVHYSTREEWCTLWDVEVKDAFDSHCESADLNRKDR
jgi:hypothetical protein